jgi:plastocyanin
MKKLLFIVIFLAVMFGAGLIINLSSGSDNQQTIQGTVEESDESPDTPNTIIMNANGFSPEQLTVKVGQSVTFVNRDDEDHWPASNDHPSHKKYSELDPKRPIKPGERWSFMFTREGQWGMHDHLFPSDRATITVTQ